MNNTDFWSINKLCMKNNTRLECKYWHFLESILQCISTFCGISVFPVCLSMSKHISGLGETLSTLWACVGLLPAVGPFMLHAGGVVSKGSCAGLALVRFLACVNPEVCAQSGLLGKGLAADGTLVRPDAGVGSHVIVQVGVSSVGLPAHRTLVFGGFKLDGR